MIEPQTNAHEPIASNIGDVRAQIDAIDQELAALVVRRCGLSASVATAKRSSGDAAFGWRPAREVEILRTVLHQQASLDPELAFCMWRGLISANLAAQGDLKVFTVADASNLAKATFSVGVTSEILDLSENVLDALVRHDHAIGVLPWPTDQNWWVMMLEPRFVDLYVCAATPLAGGNPDALLVAKQLPQAAGEDISLIIGPLDALEDGAIEGSVIAQADGVALMACGEFVSSAQPLPQGCRLLGSFALA